MATKFINIYAHWQPSGYGHFHTRISLHIISCNFSWTYCWSEIHVILGKKCFQKSVKESTHKHNAVIPSAAMGKPTFFHFHINLTCRHLQHSLPNEVKKIITNGG